VSGYERHGEEVASDEAKNVGLVVMRWAIGLGATETITKLQMMQTISSYISIASLLPHLLGVRLLMHHGNDVYFGPLRLVLKPADKAAEAVLL